MSIEVKYRAKKKLTNITIDLNKKSTDDGMEYTASQVGKYPYVYYKNLLIDPSQVEYLKLNNNKFIPYIEMKFKDNTNKISDDLFPLDNDIISLFIRSSSDYNLPIRMDFKIMEFNMIKSKKGELNDTSYVIFGDLDVNSLYYKIFKSYKGSSFDVLKKLAQENELGFATNINSTNDNMTWINPADYELLFIKKITEHSYLNDSSFLWSYIDFYYNLNYIDIETQLQENISNQKGVNNKKYITGEDDDQTLPLMLTNHPNYNSTNMYIDKWFIDNSSTQVNIESGYNTNVRYYNKNENQYNIELLDNISTVGDGTQIVLKDTPKTNDLFNNAGKDVYLGKMDTDNVHKNYLWAYQQNTDNLSFLQKIKIVIILKQPNYNLYRFQKILVELYKLSELDANNTENKNSDSTNNKNNFDEDKINQRLSGEWLITGINFTYSNKDGNIQEITLIKRELSAIYKKINK